MTKLKAIVWTRDRCDYCEMAKKELKLRDYEIEERNIWGDWHKNDLLETEAWNLTLAPQPFQLILKKLQVTTVING